jgi:peptidoglycan/LPS O-acetylase OafA/YrhL
MRIFSLDLLDNRFPALHGLRVLAILAVVQIHVTSILTRDFKLPLDDSLNKTSSAIFFGMDLFFFLSGFLIGTIILRSLDTVGTQRVRRFYLRRVFRTFPAYYAVLALLALTTTLTPEQHRHLPLEIFYLTNYGPLTRENFVMLWGWSLALEEQFYLSVPLLFFLLSRLKSDRGRVVFLAALWLSALAIRFVVFFSHASWTDNALNYALYYKTHTRFDTLVAGILLALVYLRWRVPIATWLEAPFHRALVALPSLACLGVLMSPTMFGEREELVVHVFAWGTLTSIMYFGWILLLLSSEGLVARALSAPIFRTVATLGYGIYLVHIPICDHLVAPAAKYLVKLQHVSVELVWLGAVTSLFLLALVASYVLHVVIEKPALWVRDRVAS